MRTTTALLILIVAALALGACRALAPAAEALEVTPVVAERSRQAVVAAGRIAFVAAGQVWEWSDGSARPLTRPGVRYEGADWSPNGAALAVSELGDNHSDVYVLDANGARLRPLTDHWSKVSVQDSAWGRKPAWSPEGDRIAYVSDLYRTDMSLWVVGAQGGGTNRRIYSLAKSSGGLDWPTWSPDAKKIAFTSYGPGVYSAPQVFVLTLATGVVAQLTELKEGAFDPAWSPNGTTIAFAGRGDGKTRIMTIRTDGGNLVRVTDGIADRAPAWSPDGSELAYASLNGTMFELEAVHITGTTVSEPRQLTSGIPLDAISGVSWTK